MNAVVRRLRQPVKRILLALQPPAPDSPWKVEQHELEEVKIYWPQTLNWEYAWGWVDPLFQGFQSQVSVKVVDLPQHLEGTVIIELHRGKRVYRVGVNCSDYPDVTHSGSAGAGIDLEFKMQYRNGGYGQASIVPGGYVSNATLVDWYAQGPRRARDRQQFRWDVYGRFGRQFATEVRTKVVETLERQRRVQFYGGLGTVSFKEFLWEIARSRVCIDLPGNGPFCFRFVNYLAVGACVVSVPHATSMPEPLVDRRHVVYTKPDMSDLVELCEQYVSDAPAREAIKQAARDYYRKHLYWRSLTNYYLRTMFDRLPQ